MNKMRITMPAKSPMTPSVTADQLTAMGQQIRAHRKALSISATTVAQAAGMSRVTLHRIEGGAPAVTMGAYLNAIAALGLQFALVNPAETAVKPADPDRDGWIPARIELANYPQLKQLAWQVQGSGELTPLEALDIYQRNWRHVDEPALQPHERQLIHALRLGFGERAERV
ncbi:MAG: XRE family transcriptional regulator [Comamonadaceae bacterium]|nr:MAG: XRE family transcriptional regulator [Comamonadaceae bacterium]